MKCFNKFNAWLSHATPATLLLPAILNNGKHRFRAPESKWGEYNVSVWRNFVVVYRASFIEYVLQISAAYVFIGRSPSVPSANARTASITGTVILSPITQLIFGFWLASATLWIFLVLFALLTRYITSPALVTVDVYIEFLTMLGTGFVVLMLCLTVFRL